MKFQIFTTLAILVGLSSAAVVAIEAKPPPKTPKAPGLEYLYSANLTEGAGVIVGQGPSGYAMVIPSLGGTFAGPKLKGKILAMGGDWAMVDTSALGNNSLTPDFLQVFQTDDGAVIKVTQTGHAQAANFGFLKLEYETGSEKYYWLNRVVAIGFLRRTGPSDLAVDIFQMTSL